MHNHNWVNSKEYPFKSNFLKLDAGTMHYLDQGDGDAIVMIHGNPTWSFLYRNLIKKLQPEYRCIAPDHIGFGLSDKPTSWSYRPEDHAKNLAALIEHLNLKNITIVAQDWGGPIGLAYAVDHPENVARIVLMNTWAWSGKRDPHFIGFSAFMGGPIGRFLIRRYNFFVRTLMRLAFGDKSRLSELAHQHYIRPLEEVANRKGCMVFPKEIIASSPWLETLWQKIQVLSGKPKLLVWGMKDFAFREKELQRWQTTFPESQTVRLPGVGHFVQEEAPQELAEATLKFLRQHPLQTPTATSYESATAEV